MFCHKYCKSYFIINWIHWIYTTHNIAVCIYEFFLHMCYICIIILTVLLSFLYSKNTGSTLCIHRHEVQTSNVQQALIKIWKSLNYSRFKGETGETWGLVLEDKWREFNEAWCVKLTARSQLWELERSNKNRNAHTRKNIKVCTQCYILKNRHTIYISSNQPTMIHGWPSHERYILNWQDP